MSAFASQTICGNCMKVELCGLVIFCRLKMQTNYFFTKPKLKMQIFVYVRYIVTFIFNNLHGLKAISDANLGACILFMLSECF